MRLCNNLDDCSDEMEDITISVPRGIKWDFTDSSDPCEVNRIWVGLTCKHNLLEYDHITEINLELVEYPDFSHLIDELPLNVTLPNNSSIPRPQGVYLVYSI